MKPLSWRLDICFLGILANGFLGWSMIAFCRTTIFEFWKSTALMLAPAILPIFRSPAHAGTTNFACSRSHFWGRKMDPFLGPLVIILIRMVPFGGPKTGTQRSQIFGPNFWFLGPEDYFLYPPFQATTVMCCLLLRSRCWSIFWGQL